MKNLEQHAPKVMGALRIMTGLLFLAHGTQKLLGFPTTEWSPELFSIFWVSGVLELIGGTLITLGLFTRPVAFVLSGHMAFAYFMGHATKNFFPVNNGGDPVILYCFVFLYLAFSGAGPLSLDSKRAGG